MSKPSDTSTPAEEASPSTDMARNLFIEEGQKLLAIIRRVEESQANWNSFLEQVYATEAAEGERCTALTREVLLDEAESLANPEFVRWMAARDFQQLRHRAGKDSAAGDDKSTASDRISEWFHHDGLALETPFAAMVPFPKSLSCEGNQFFASSVDELMRESCGVDGDDDTAAVAHSGSAAPLRAPWYIGTTAIGQPLVTLASALRGSDEPPRHELPVDTAVVPSCGVSKSESAEAARAAGNMSCSGGGANDAAYLSFPCRSGDDVVAVIEQSVRLQAALSETPCVFLSSSRPQYERVARIVVVRGVLVVVEMTEFLDATDPSSVARSSAVDTDKQQCAELVEYVYRDVVIPQTPQRSFTALLVLRRAPKRTCGFRWCLWTMSELNVEALEAFTPEECITIAKVVSLLQRRKQQRQAQQLPTVASGGSESPPRNLPVVFPVFRAVTTRTKPDEPRSQEALVAQLARELRVLLSADDSSSISDVPRDIVAAAALVDVNVSSNPGDGGCGGAPSAAAAAAAATADGDVLRGSVEADASWSERRHTTTTLVWTVVGVAAATAGVMLAVTSRKR